MSTTDPTSTTPRRAAIYARISEDREGREFGVDRQRVDCRALADRRAFDVVREFCDNDISASTASTKPRPGYDAMIAAVRAGEVDVILAYSSSRLTRRPREWEDLIELNEATGVQIFTVVSGDNDLTTASGRRVARINYSIAAGEAEEIRERIHRANKHRVEVLGEPTNGTKYGWRRGLGGKLELDPEQAAVVQEVARRVVAGESLNRIKKDFISRAIPTPRVVELAHKAQQGKVTDLTSRGIPPEAVKEIADRTIAGEPLTFIVADLNARRARIPQWSHASLTSLVRRPANVARIEYQGQTYPGTFPPILEGDTYEKALLILGDESRTPRRPVGMRHREIVHFLSGVTVCGKPAENGTLVLSDGTRVCGTRMRVRTDTPSRRAKSPERQLAKQTTYQSYSCPHCNGTSCRTYQAEAAVRDVVLEYLGDPQAPSMLSGDPAEVAAQEVRIAGLTERRRRTARAYADGAYDDEEYTDLRRDIDADLTDARRRLAAAGPRPELTRWLPNGNKAAQPVDPEAMWDRATPGERRDLVAALMTVVILPGGRGRKEFDPDQRLRFESRVAAPAVAA